jgi:capsular polysaccharide biosynthesis protein
MSTPIPERELTVRDYLRPAWEWRWALLVLVVLVTAGSYLYYRHQPARYSAATELYAQSSSASIPSSGAGVPSPQAAERSVLDVATLTDSLTVAALARRELGTSTPAHTLASDVEAAPLTGSDFLTITARSGSASGAAALANAFAHAVSAVESDGSRAQVRSAVAQTERGLAALTGPQTSSQRASVELQLQQLKLLLAVPAIALEQVSPARPPGAPDSPRPVRNALFAFVLALLAGVVLAYALAAVRR